MSSHSSSLSSTEMQYFDINKPYMFKEWYEWLCMHISTCDYAGDTMCAMRKSRLDDYVLKLRMTGDLMHVAPGAMLGNQRYPEGLNGDQYAQLFPPEHVTAAQATLNSKYRREYTQRAGRCIAGILSKMVVNTRRFMENEIECKRAIDDRDLVAFVHYLKTRGIVGTRDKEEACQSLELRIGNQHESTLLMDENGNCDMTRYAMSWRDHAETLSQLGSTMSMRTIVKGFINGLPEEYNLMKGPILANPPATLHDAIKYFSDMVIHQHVSLDDCGVVFGVAKAAKTKSKAVTFAKRDRDDENEERAPKDQVDLEKMVVALQADIKDMGNRFSKYHRGSGRGGGGRGNEGRGNEGRGKQREGRELLFDRLCKEFETDKVCTYEKRTKKACRFNHQPPYAKNAEGEIRPVKFAEKSK
jgi:hypothetical protein